jgi:hypothetical protein
VTFKPEEILDYSVNRHESLRLSGGFEPLHLSFALSRRLVRDFSSMMGVKRSAVNIAAGDTAFGTGLPRSVRRDAGCRPSEPAGAWVCGRIRH